MNLWQTCIAIAKTYFLIGNEYLTRNAKNDSFVQNRVVLDDNNTCTKKGIYILIFSNSDKIKTVKLNRNVK